MFTKTVHVFVDRKTADEKKITESDGRPANRGGEGVYVGSVEVNQYELKDWDGLTEVQRLLIIDKANTILAAESANAHRADVKNGGSLSLTKQRELHIQNVPTDPTEMGAWAKELQRLNQEVADAAAAKKAAK